MGRHPCHVTVGWSVVVIPQAGTKAVRKAQTSRKLFVFELWVAAKCLGIS